jgi:hypothetical protein
MASIDGELFKQLFCGVKIESVAFSETYNGFGNLSIPNKIIITLPNDVPCGKHNCRESGKTTTDDDGATAQ